MEPCTTRSRQVVLACVEARVELILLMIMH